MCFSDVYSATAIPAEARNNELAWSKIGQHSAFLITYHLSMSICCQTNASPELCSGTSLLKWRGRSVSWVRSLFLLTPTNLPPMSCLKSSVSDSTFIHYFLLFSWDAYTFVEGLKFWSRTVRLFKPNHQGNNKNSGSVTYLGSISDCPEQFKFSSELVFQKMETIKVEQEVFLALQGSRFAKHFRFDWNCFLVLH